jgi:PAS domain S-box-containing protein
MSGNNSQHFVGAPPREKASEGLAARTVSEGSASTTRHVDYRSDDETPTEVAPAVLDATPDGIVLTDQDARIQLVNRQTEHLFGYRRDELLGQPIELLLPERFREAHRDFCRRLRTEPGMPSMGALLVAGRHRDGAEFPVEISLGLLPAASGRLRVIVAVRDITDRLVADDRVREVQRMLDATHDAVLMFDPNTLMLTYVNQGAIDQLGYTREELLTMTAADLNPTITDDSCRTIVSRFGPGKSSVFTTVHRRKDGTDVPVEVLLERPAHDPEGSGWLVGVARDITERLEAERRAQEAERSLAVLEERQRLSRDVHDIVGHGLTVMALQAEAARLVLDVDVEQAREFLNAIGLIGRHAAEDLDVALAGTPAAPPDPGLGHGLANLPILLETMRSAGLRVHLAVTGDIHAVSALSDRSAYRILQEALTNAAKHAPGAPVEVTLCVGEHDLHLRVVDEGCTTPARSEVPEGRGLRGMRQRVAMLGGQIELGPNLDRGFTVSVSLPR